MSKKYSLSIRIDSINMAHIRFTFFDAMIPVEGKHEDYTRAKAGESITSTEAFPHFIQHIKPHVITRSSEVSQLEIDMFIRQWYEFQEARADWDFAKWVRKES